MMPGTRMAPHGAEALRRALEMADRVMAFVAGDSGTVLEADASGYTAIRWAGIRGHRDVLLFLARAGADLLYYSYPVQLLHQGEYAYGALLASQAALAAAASAASASVSARVPSAAPSSSPSRLTSSAASLELRWKQFVSSLHLIKLTALSFLPLANVFAIVFHII